MKLGLIAAVAALSLAAAGAASASVTDVTSEAALAPNDFIDWGQLGGSFTSLSNAFDVQDTLGNTVNVSSGGNMYRLDEGNGWNGNFAYGERLLWTDQNGPDITLNFNAPVFGVGAQIQADFFGSFQAEIIGSNGAVLGSFQENGYSDSNGDGSAIFIGLKSTTSIAQIRFDLTDAYYAPNDFAIGHVAINTTGGVPEPASWALMILGFGAIGAATRGRRAAAAA